MILADEERVSQRVVTHVVAWRVCKHPEDDQATNGGVLGGKISLLRDGPAGVHAKQRACAQEIHRTALEALHDESKSQGIDEVPAVETDVELALHLRVCKADLGENSVKVVGDKRVARLYTCS